MVQRKGKRRVQSSDLGAEENIHIIGRLTNDRVDVLLVEDPESENKFAHITLGTADGVKPVESNSELETNYKDIVPLDDYVFVKKGASIDGAKA
ncbi:MAG: hypothetical protein MJZ73_08700 [Bacteroidaceae bacterium]|nr:hypothetical protein [Bacteroidaceae bacterium]